MTEINVFVKYGPGNIVTITGPDFYYRELFPGSEVHLKFSVYEKEKKK